MRKLLVFCLDALCTSDLEYLKTLPNLGQVFKNGSYVEHLEPVYPSLTYPCHVSLLTGNYVDKHRVPHNEKLKIGFEDQPWYNQRSDIKCDTFLDIAKTNGYTTCSISWPVTGGADFDLNMPMIVPIGYSGNEPIKFLLGNATDELLEKYYQKYSHFLIGEDRSLDKYTMALALDIIRDYGQPDVMLVKMCDLDSAHHMYGINDPHVLEQLDIHDHQFGLILDRIRECGDIDDTNFVIFGDHGQSNITQGINLNVLLKQNGFIEVDEHDNFVDYDAYSFSGSLSAWIKLKDEKDREMYQKVYNFLDSLTKDKKFGIGHIFTKEEAEEKFHLTGPFDFIIEGEKPVAFSSTLKGDDIFDQPRYSNYSVLKASHGGLPWKDETTTFIASGPNVQKSVVIDRRSLVDAAPTMAAFMGFEMNNIDGRVITEMIN